MTPSVLVGCIVSAVVGLVGGWWLRSCQDESDELRRAVEWEAGNALDAHKCWRKAFREASDLRARLHRLECTCLAFAESVQEMTNEPEENNECDSHTNS